MSVDKNFEFTGTINCKDCGKSVAQKGSKFVTTYDSATGLVELRCDACWAKHFGYPEGVDPTEILAHEGVDY